MNSLNLLQQVCSHWLTETEQTQLSARDAESLLSATNAAMRKVWAALPVTYRQQTLSIDFPASAATTATVQSNSRALTGAVGTLNPDFCSLSIEGDGTMNEYRKSGTTPALFHPYRGTSGSKTATVFYDAALLPYQVDRFTSQLRDVTNNQPWEPVESILKNPNNGIRREFTLQMVSTRGSSYTLIRITAGNASALTFAVEAIIRPSPLSLLDSQQATNLPFPDEVGDWIARAAGTFLLTHPKLRPEVAKIAPSSADFVLGEIESTISPTITGGRNSVGTPRNW